MPAKLLLVLTPHRQFELWKLLEEKDYRVFSVAGLRDAQRELTGPTSYDLLIADAELPDGSWRDILQSLLESPEPCDMLVCSRCGDDELWAEVLQCGAYDLLVEPYTKQEVHRIIESALESKYIRRFLPLALKAAS